MLLDPGIKILLTALEYSGCLTYSNIPISVSVKHEIIKKASNHGFITINNKTIQITELGVNYIKKLI